MHRPPIRPNCNPKLDSHALPLCLFLPVFLLLAGLLAACQTGATAPRQPIIAPGQNVTVVAAANAQVNARQIDLAHLPEPAAGEPDALEQANRPATQTEITRTDAPEINAA